MNSEKIIELVQEKVKKYIPDFENAKISVMHNVAPSQDFIRVEMRKRGEITPNSNVTNSAPIVHHIVFMHEEKILKNTTNKRILVVIADDGGNIVKMYESR